MSSKVIFKPSASAVAQVTQLPDLSMKDLKDLWFRLFNADAPTHVRSFLERRLAYRIQELEFKRKHKNLAEKNERRINAIIHSGKKPLRDRYPQPLPGTVLTRIYKEKEHRVTVTHDGLFEFEGRIFNSLSVIAREITGTRWSGPLFFGLRKAVYQTKTKRGKK